MTKAKGGGRGGDQVIYADGLCSECKRYPAPDWDYKEGCPEQPRVFWSPEAEQRDTERQEMELRHAIEARARREAAEARELAWAKASGVLGEYLEAQRQAKFAAAREACEEGLAWFHEYREARETGERLLRKAPG